MENVNQKLLTFLGKNPDSTKVDILRKTGIKGIQLYNLLRSLLKEEKIVEREDDVEKYYSLKTEIEQVKADSSELNLETPAEKTKQKVSTPTGRDNSKFKFNGELFGKGPLIRAVVAQYVADNPNTTYKQLKSVFPDELLKRFGIFQDETTAKAIAPKGGRYFEKPEQMIKLKDRKVVVCNQFTLSNIQPFLKVARSLGYKIK